MEPVDVPAGLPLDLNLVIAQARRHGRGFVGDPYIDTAFKIAALIPSQDCMATVLIDGQIGTFGSDNYGSLPLFCMEGHQKLKKGNSLILRRFEPGPREPVSKLPYKTVGGAFYNTRAKSWMPLSEAEMKSDHTTDAATGRKLPAEPDIRYSTIPKMFPGLLPE